MGHNIHFNESTQQHSFFSVKEKAWHGLGQIVEGYSTSAEVLKFAGLDYTVAKRKLFTFDNENEAANEDIEIKISEMEVPLKWIKCTKELAGPNKNIRPSIICTTSSLILIRLPKQ